MKLPLQCYPVNGGVVRNGNAPQFNASTWSGVQVNADATLKYDVFATIIVRPDPVSPPPVADTAHILLSEWKLNK